MNPTPRIPPVMRAIKPGESIGRARLEQLVRRAFGVPEFDSARVDAIIALLVNGRWLGTSDGWQTFTRPKKDPDLTPRPRTWQCNLCGAGGLVVGGPTHRCAGFPPSTETPNPLSAENLVRQLEAEGYRITKTT
jgi:hypothetical protein